MNSIQSPSLMLLLYVAIFVGILLAYDGFRQLTSKSERPGEARNRRMRMVNKGAAPDEVLNLLLDGNAGKNPKKLGLLAKISRSLRQAGLPIGLFGFFSLLLLVAAFLSAIISRLLAPDLAVLASVVATFLLATIIISGLRKRRLTKLTAQLPDALDLMSRGLSIGHPLNVTVNSVATDMPDPIGSEFGIIQDQVSYGDDIVTAFAAFADRVEIEDASYLAVSVGIQHGTGGNLGRVLQVLSKVIRDRATMRQKIHAISAEGRLSAMILTLLPFFIFGSIHVSTPSYYGDVSSDPLFMPFAVTIIALVALQGIILNRLVNFKF